MSWHPKFFV